MDSPDIINKLFTPLCRETFFEDMMKKFAQTILIAWYQESSNKEYISHPLPKGFYFLHQFLIKWLLSNGIGVVIPLASLQDCLSWKSKNIFDSSAKYLLRSKIIFPSWTSTNIFDYFVQIFPKRLLVIKMAKWLPLKDCLFFEGKFLTMLWYWIKYTVANRCCHN